MAITVTDVAKAIEASQAAQEHAKNWSPRLVTWGDIYRQACPEVTFELAGGTYTRTRKTLGMGKKVPEDWAGLCWTEKASVTAGDEGAPEALLLESHFGERFAPAFGNFLESESFALGTGALEWRIEGMTVGTNPPFPQAKLTLDLVPAECVLMLDWKGRDVTRVAFYNVSTKYVDVRVHDGDESMRTIEFMRFSVVGSGSSARLGGRVSDEELLAAGIAPLVGIEGAPKLFAIIRPQIANNLDKNSPYGVSVFANAGSQLEGVDMAWDNHLNDIELGRRLVGIPASMLRKDADGNLIPPQKDMKSLFIALQDNPTGDKAPGVWEYVPDLRVEQNQMALNMALTALSIAVGLGEERYRYRGETVATATQIISENSEAFRTRAKHLLAITDALQDMGRALLWLARYIVGDTSIDPEAEVIVRTDDSIIEDDATIQTRGASKVAQGVMSLKRYLMECEGLSEEAAIAEAAEIGNQNTGGELFE